MSIANSATPNRFAGRSERIFLLDPSEETPFLLWPAAILVALVITGYFTGPITKWHEGFLHLLSATLFLNLVHHYFSALLLVFVPESREWLGSLPPGRRALLLGKWALLFAFLLVFFGYGYSRLSRHFHELHFRQMMDFVLLSLTFYQHTLQQIKGIAVAYHQTLLRSVPLSDTERNGLESQSRWERRLLSAMLYISCAGLATRIFRWPEATNVLGCLSLACFISLMLVSWRLAPVRNTHKSLYLLRTIFYPLGIWNPLFSFGVPFFHGVEYTFLCRKMVRASSLPRQSGQKVFLLAVLPVIAFGLVASALRPGEGGVMSAYAAGTFPALSPVFFVMVTISYSMQYLHFYLDREIFRMKDPNVRRTIGRLLVPGQAGP